MSERGLRLSIQCFRGNTSVVIRTRDFAPDVNTEAAPYLYKANFDLLIAPIIYE